MDSLQIFNRPLFLASLMMASLGLHSGEARAQSELDPQSFAEHLISDVQSLPSDLNTRLEFVSRSFLGKPYLMGGPLGEGNAGDFDQDPLYRFDGFDCTTYVETTLSLAEAQNFSDFFHRLLHIRYDQGQISFVTRNHFVELDWNPHNIAAGFFADRTESLGTANDRGSVTQVFSKKEWYSHLPESEIKIPGASTEEIQTKLEALHRAGEIFPDVTSHLPYLKKASLLKISNQLPVPAVLNIVRNVPGQNGMPAVTEVTHQVLLLEVNGKLHIRAASSRTAVMQVVDMSFEDYVSSLIQSPSTLGVNFLQIL